MISFFSLFFRVLLYTDVLLCALCGAFLLYASTTTFPSLSWQILFNTTNTTTTATTEVASNVINLFATLAGSILSLFSLQSALVMLFFNRGMSQKKKIQQSSSMCSSSFFSSPQKVLSLAPCLMLCSAGLLYLIVLVVIFMKTTGTTLRSYVWVTICTLSASMLVLHVIAVSQFVYSLFWNSTPTYGHNFGDHIFDPLLVNSGTPNKTQPASSAGTESKQNDPQPRLHLGTKHGAPTVSASSTSSSSSSSIALHNLAAAEQAEQSHREKRGYGTIQLLKIARPHRHWLYWACAVLLVRLPLSLSVPHWVAETISCLIDSNYKGAYWNVLYLCLAGTGDAVLDFWCVYLFGMAQQKIIRGLRLQLFDAILKQEIGFFDCTKTGEITSRLTTDCAEMANDLTSVFRFTIESIVRIGGIITYMFVRSWRLGLLALAVIPITSLINRVYAKFMHYNQKAVQAALAEANSVAQEAIGAVRTVCSFAMEAGEYTRYQSRIEVYYNLIVRQYCIQGVYYMVCNTFLINTAVQAAILGYGAFLIHQDLLHAKVLLAFMLYQGQLQEYFQNLFNSFTSLIKSSGAAAKVFDYIDRRPRYKRQRIGPTAIVKTSTRAMQEQNLVPITTAENIAPDLPLVRAGSISFQNVHFCYPSRPETEVLRGISIDIAPGACVALVGASGNGKSTIFSLLEHFYEPQRGHVCIDGVDVADYSHIHLHRMVAMVQQEPQLMSGTIEENILYGIGQDGLRHSERWSTVGERESAKTRVIAAAKAANAHTFIVNELQNGYQTEVGERGVQLSGGQKQRIAIARCLMQDPKILLLDEATSALDSESESIVQEALERAMKGRTTLIIAHRLSTIRNADMVFVIDGGRVAECGTHDMLLSNTQGLYYKLVQHQLAGGT